MTPLTPALFTLHEVRQVQDNLKFTEGAIRFVGDVLSVDGKKLGTVQLAMVMRRGEAMGAKWYQVELAGKVLNGIFVSQREATGYVRETLGLTPTRKSEPPSKLSALGAAADSLPADPAADARVEALFAEATKGRVIRKLDKPPAKPKRCGK